jgi:hypothetical protein
MGGSLTAIAQKEIAGVLRGQFRAELNSTAQAIANEVYKNTEDFLGVARGAIEGGIESLRREMRSDLHDGESFLWPIERILFLAATHGLASAAAPDVSSMRSVSS